MKAADVVVFLDSQPYSPRSNINRASIKTADGRKEMTVPILRPEHQNMAAKEIRIDPMSNWRRTHKAGLVSSYGNTPYYEYYFPHFEEFLSHKRKQLIECNLAGIELINRLLRRDMDYVFSSEIRTSGSREERVIQLLERFGCSSYVIEAGSESFFQSWLLEERGYSVDFIAPGRIEYEQQFSGFCRNLSIIDLLFNEGPYTVALLGPMENLTASAIA